MTPRNESQIPCLDAILGLGPKQVSIEERCGLVQAVRSHSPEWAKQLDCVLLDRVATQHKALEEAEANQKKMRGVFEKLTAPPWHMAVFHSVVTTPKGPQARVTSGGARIVVGADDGIDLSTLAPGECVFLGNERNVILCRSGLSAPEWGEMAIFNRWVSDGWMVVRSRDEEIKVEAAAALRQADLRSGDEVRWTREDGMAFEKMLRSKESSFFLEDTPEETFDNIGGLAPQIAAIQRSIRLHANHIEIVRKYRLRRKGSITLVGSPGGGKTMLARALANWLGRLSPSGRCRFMDIKPSALHSMWYSQSEANYREAFRVAREIGQEDPGIPVIMFFDEVDSIGGSRGSLMRVDDRVLTAFMAELDGLKDRGNILVVAATNRRDVIDPALLRPGRLGDTIIEVPRPNMEAARDIFGKYLHPDTPYGSGNGHPPDPEEARRTIIDTAVSRIFAPNSEGELATLVFRDGKRRPVLASDLISGAVIAKIASSAIEHACVREVETERAGVLVEDFLSAIAEEFQMQVGSLTPANCRQHLADLPQDVDVIAVEPVARKVPQPHRYMHLDVA